MLPVFGLGIGREKADGEILKLFQLPAEFGSIGRRRLE